MNTLQLQFLMLIFAGWVNRSQQDAIEYLQEENRVLHEQLGGKRLLFADGQRRHLAAKAKGIGRKGLFAIEQLIIWMARDNPRWGYTRIRGALLNLGREIGRDTIKRILLENGFDPPSGRRGLPSSRMENGWSRLCAISPMSMMDS
jgi:hypothetical protein